MKIINQMGIAGCISIGVLLTGCQSLNSDLGSVNAGLSHLTSDNSSAASSSTGSSHISNNWHVTDSQAMAWLSHDQITWSDNGRLKNVNWYTFWSQQIHYKTALSAQAYQYCHKNAWDTPAGANCQTYFEAYSMTNAQERQIYGDQMIQDVSN